MHRVKVRRERPAAAAWALAVLLTALFVFLIARGAGTQSGEETPESAPRRAYALTFAPLETHLVQFGAYEDALSARIEAARYMPRGAAGYVLAAPVPRDRRGIRFPAGRAGRVRTPAGGRRHGGERLFPLIGRGGADHSGHAGAKWRRSPRRKPPWRNAAAQLNETAFGYDRGELSSEDARQPSRDHRRQRAAGAPGAIAGRRAYGKIRPSTHFSPFYPIWPLKRSNFPMKMLPRVFPFPAESSIIISVCV